MATDNIGKGAMDQSKEVVQKSSDPLTFPYVVEEDCAGTDESIFDLLLESDWDSVMRRIVSDPDAALDLDAEGDNPLHYAVRESTCPMEVVKGLVEMGGNQLICQGREDGTCQIASSPLHVALTTHPGEDMEGDCPDRTNEIIVFFLEQVPSALLRRPHQLPSGDEYSGEEGGNCLETFMEFWLEWESFPTYGDESEPHRCELFETSCEGSITDSVRRLQAMEFADSSRADVLRRPSDFLSGDFRIMYNRLEILFGSPAISGYSSLLHAVCATYPFVPKSLFRTILVVESAFSNGRVGYTLDQHAGNGKTPLTLAAVAQGTFAEASDDADDTAPVIRSLERFSMRAEIIRQLMQAFPGSSAVRDASTRRPALHSAIVAGVSWDDGLELIHRDYPEALEERDPRTGLYPFMLAATSVSISCSGAKGDFAVNSRCKNIIGAESSYMMLREAPALLSRWLAPSATDRKSQRRSEKDTAAAIGLESQREPEMNTAPIGHETARDAENHKYGMKRKTTCPNAKATP